MRYIAVGAIENAIALGVAAVTPSLYLAQAAAGTGDGSSPANAKAVSFFNSAGNWGVGQPIRPGAVVALCGTITTALVFQGGGAPGSPVTLYFMPSARMTSPAFVGGAILATRKDYIVVDGGANGLIENTANGSNRAYQISSCGVGGDTCNHMTVRNLTVRNIYVHDDPTDVTSQNLIGACVSNECGQSLPLTGFVVHDCTLSHAGIGIDGDYGVNSDISDFDWHHNTITHCNWGGRIGDRGGGGTTSNIRIHHNNVSQFANWDTDTDLYHHNGFYVWAESGGALRDVHLYANTIGPGYGFCDGRAGGCATSGLFSSGNIADIWCYNNLFLADPGGDSPASGFIVLWSTLAAGSGNTGLRALYNTIAGTGGGKGVAFIGQGGYEAKGNVISDVDTYVSWNNNGGAGSLDSDYNLCFSGKPGELFSQSATGTGSFYDFAGWQGLGHEANGQVADPLLTTSYHLGLGSPGIAAGVNLSGAFGIDKDGAPRPATGPWDVGAYERAG